MKENGLTMKWFDNAELPLHLVDGAPESSFHLEKRDRINTNGSYHGFDNYKRDCLQDPNWLICLEQALGRRRRRRREEQMED